MTIEELTKTINACRVCPIGQKRLNAVVGRGNIQSYMMIIAEAPGENEDIQGIPLTGPAGKLLYECLGENGINDKFAYATNVVKCRPTETSSYGRIINRQPNEEETKNCSSFLDHQVKIVNPLFILCVGSPSLKRIIDPSLSIMKSRGIIFKSVYNIPAMPVLHPSFVLRQKEDYEYYKKQLINDIAKAKEETRRLYREKFNDLPKVQR